MRINPIDPSIRKQRRPKNRAQEESSWRKFGTDAQFQEWCRKKPSAYSGKNNHIVFAHYRTAKNSGTGIKPVYSGIPLTMQEHQIQHSVGQFSFMTKDRWEYLVQIHLENWAKSKSKLDVNN